MGNHMKPAPPTLAVYWQAEVKKTETAKLVRRTRKYRCRSFVNNFLQGFANHLSGLSTTVVDTGGSSFSAIQNASNFLVNYNADNDDEGIVVGSGTTAVDGADFALATLIVDGAGAGQLSYPASGGSVGTVAAGAAIASVDITRSFGNSSGGSITVNEIGLIVRMTVSGPSVRDVLIIRDLTGAIVVSDGETLTVTYTLKTTV